MMLTGNRPASAVELVPGDPPLISLETAARKGDWPGVDMFDFVAGSNIWAATQDRTPAGA